MGVIRPAEHLCHGANQQQITDTSQQLQLSMSSSAAVRLHSCSVAHIQQSQAQSEQLRTLMLMLMVMLALFFSESLCDSAQIDNNSEASLRIQQKWLTV